MNQKAFTLVEIAVTAIIVGILVMVAVPNMTKMTSRGYAQDAFNNFMALYTGQQAYAQKNNDNFCTGTACDTTAKINTVLNLNIVGVAGMNYNCSVKPCTVSPTTGTAFTMNLNLSLPFVSTRPVFCANSTPTVPDSTYNPCCTGSGSNQGQACP